MEDKTKSTLAHVASIATAVAGIITALVTGSPNLCNKLNKPSVRCRPTAPSKSNHPS